MCISCDEHVSFFCPTEKRLKNEVSFRMPYERWVKRIKTINPGALTLTEAHWRALTLTDAHWRSLKFTDARSEALICGWSDRQTKVCGVCSATVPFVFKGGYMGIWSTQSVRWTVVRAKRTLRMFRAGAGTASEAGPQMDLREAEGKSPSLRQHE